MGSSNIFNVGGSNKILSRILGTNGGSFVQDHGKKVIARIPAAKLPIRLTDNSDFMKKLQAGEKIEQKVGERQFSIEVVLSGPTLVMETKHPEAMYLFLNPNWNRAIQRETVLQEA